MTIHQDGDQAAAIPAERPLTREMDVQFVLHGDDGGASAWAARARPGDPVALWGPREAFQPPSGTDWYLIVADDTGLPAVAAVLDALPATSPADTPQFVSR